MNATTTTTRTSKKKARKEVSPALRTVTLPEARQELHHLTLLLPPAAEDDLLALADDVLAAAKACDIDDMFGLVSHHKDVLRWLTGLKDITTFLKSADAERLHRYRNMIHTLAILATASFGGDTTPVHANITKLRARTPAIRRAWADDEILLTRAAVYAQATVKRTDQKALLYCLIEAGMTPGEATTFTPNAYGIQAVDAPGNHQLDARTLVLDPFPAHILGGAVAAARRTGTAGDQTLAYTSQGTNCPGSGAATASAQGIIDRFLDELGLQQQDTTASSIRLWRINRARTQDGIEAALTISGISGRRRGDAIARLYRHLGMVEPSNTPDEDYEPQSFAI